MSTKLTKIIGPAKYDGTAVTAAAEQAWSMWLKGEKKGHDDNIPEAQYPHNSIPLQSGDHFKNDCDNDADTVIQFPIIGDGVYDGSQEQGMDRVALKDMGDKRSAVFCGLVTERVCFSFSFIPLSLFLVFFFWFCVCKIGHADDCRMRMRHRVVFRSTACAELIHAVVKLSSQFLWTIDYPTPIYLRNGFHDNACIINVMFCFGFRVFPRSITFSQPFSMFVDRDLYM